MFNIHFGEENEEEEEEEKDGNKKRNYEFTEMKW